MKAMKLLPICLMILASGCAEPDEPAVKTTAQVQSNAASAPATEEFLNQKYSRLELNCKLDIKSKSTAPNSPTAETKSITSTFNLLKNLGQTTAANLQLTMTNLEAQWTLTIRQVTLEHVSYTSATDTFEADRSPVVDAVLEGKLIQPTQPVSGSDKSFQMQNSNSQILLYETVSTNLLSLTEGSANDPNLSVQMACQLDAILKPEYISDFRRK